MKRLSVGRVLVSVVAGYAACGAYFFDWNATHIFNSRWPPHAKFHNAQTLLLGSTTGLFALGVLWVAHAEERFRLRVAAGLASLYWLTQAGALAFPGTALVDPEFARPGDPPHQLVVDAVALAVLGIGYGLEARKLRQRASQSSAQPPST